MYPSNIFDASLYGNSMDSANQSDSSSSSMGNNMKTRDMLRWKSGKKLDPGLLTLLELFGEMYTERHEFFKETFNGRHEEVFKKVGNVLKRKKTMKKVRSMSRSLSMRAINNQRGIDDGIDGMRLERFKIRTPNVIVAEPSDQGQGQGGHTSPRGSSNN